MTEKSSLRSPALVEKVFVHMHMFPLGVHLIAEFYGCQRVDDPEFVRTELVNAAVGCGATVLGSDIHHFGDGFGVTGVVLLAESHISIHTWPEYDYAAIDVFVCGSKADPKIAVKHLEKSFCASRVEISTLQRGSIGASKKTEGV